MFKQHPKGLYILFFTEMWERFSYYGMRAILSLYMINALLYDTARTSSIYGYYTAFVYLTPLLGGYIADRYWGNRRSIVFGGSVMAIGQFALTISGQFYDTAGISQPFFFLGLFLLVFGNGFFKPNISTMVGSLYPQGDRRRDSAFTIFYMGINLGAFLSPLICGGLGETGNPADFKYGFLAAGIGMTLGVLFFLWGRNKFLVTPEGAGIGLQPAKADKNDKNDARNQPLTTVEKQRIAVVFIIAFFVIFFWAAFEQAGVSLTFFADQQTDRVVGWLGNYEIPASFFQSINALAIIVFAPVFALIWTKLGDRDLEPSSPLKMSLGLLFLSLGYLIIVIGAGKADTGVKVSPLWLTGMYVLHTFGELCLSPIGLSMVSKLAPAKFASLLMGVWFLANAAANWLAGMLSTLYPENGVATYFLGFQIPDLSSFFMIFMFMAAAASLILFLLYKTLVKLMHGVK
jgi:POT family proton-dependent oligopeptide transporter